MRLDTHNVFKFSPISGETAKTLGLNISSDWKKQSIIYYRDAQNVFQRSDAALQICLDLFQFKIFFQILFFCPRFIRDALYNFIAYNRYRFFGKREDCRIPTAEEKSRFLG